MPPPLKRDRCRASCLRRACVVPATCVQQREDDKPPPPTHTSAPPRVGDEGREGRTAPPPPENKAARWGSSGERVRDGPHNRARRKHAPCKPQRRGRRGCERRVGRATTGATRHAPPPPAEGQVPRLVPAPRLRCAYARGRTARTPPPPSPPPTQERGEDSEETARGHGGGQRTDRRARGRDGRRAVETHNKQKKRTKQINAPGEESEEAGTNTATNGGRPGRQGPARDAGEVPDLGGMGGGPKGKPPPTAAKCLALCLRRACVVPATCVLQREDAKPPPPPTHTPPPPRGWEMTVAERGPPPEDKAAGWGGSGERVRDGPHDRVRGEHAPCKPQRGDHRGGDRRVGRATTGATGQAPPPPTCRGTSAAPRACTVLAMCLRQRTGSEKAPPPPPRRGDSEGTWGGAEDRPVEEKKNKGHQRASAGADSRGRRDTAGTRKHGKGRGKGGHPWGRKLGGRDQHRSERGGGGGLGWQEPAKDAGEVPDLRGLGAPPGVRINPT